MSSCMCGAQTMYLLLGTPAVQVEVEDAPHGCEVYQMKGETWLQSQHFPIDKYATYNIRGYTRWLGKDDPAHYYATVYEYNSAKEMIITEGRYFWYFESAIKPTNSDWIVHQARLGVKGTRQHHPDAKYFSFGIGVNYRNGKGTYQTCGWTVSMQF
eukprot:Phypoly_transcript_21154.p1 GENE.Phypoly_transcript_21154~~Phypoly_transcript_21154.p1  ORF type:complete len:156 (+),score=11.00 Phypoly_transcript_21154:105-572(+)